MSISSDWAEFERNVLPNDFGAEQRRKVKLAYYTSAASILDRLLTFTREPGADVFAFLCEAQIELQALANSLAREVTQGRGL